MRPVLSFLCYALTAVLGADATFLITYPSEATFRVTSTGSRLIPVLVGGNTLTFTPNSVTANPGDVIQFQFAARNHTVTQSTQTSPCQPLGGNSSSAAGGAQLGIHSGFIPFDGGSAGVVGTFDVPVLDTKPMFLYCAQANHCQSGMVMVVNAQSADLITYAQSAALATSNVPARQVAGGIAAKIPLSAAIVPLTPPSASSGRPGSASTSRQSTQTVTRASTNFATATVTGKPSVVGGGTATATATTVVVVGPSGAAAAATSGGGRGAGNGTVISATGQPVAAVPFQFTGAASAGRAKGFAPVGRGGAVSLLVSVGAAALGSSLFLGVARR